MTSVSFVSAEYLVVSLKEVMSAKWWQAAWWMRFLAHISNSLSQGFYEFCCSLVDGVYVVFDQIVQLFSVRVGLAVFPKFLASRTLVLFSLKTERQFLFLSVNITSSRVHEVCTHHSEAFPVPSFGNDRYLATELRVRCIQRSSVDGPTDSSGVGGAVFSGWGRPDNIALAFVKLSGIARHEGIGLGENT
jgi:hypothetical protein